MNLTIIANPIAGRGRAYQSLQRYVRQWPHPDWQCELLPTRRPNHAGMLARELLAHPPDLLAVCGGDGTMNEIATAVPEPPFPVALLPAGTANVLARELGLPLNPVRALKIALNGNARKIDLGLLGPGLRRRFLFVAGIKTDRVLPRPGNLGSRNVKKTDWSVSSEAGSCSPCTRKSATRFSRTKAQAYCSSE